MTKVNLLKGEEEEERLINLAIVEKIMIEVSNRKTDSNLI